MLHHINSLKAHIRRIDFAFCGLAAGHSGLAAPASIGACSGYHVRRIQPCPAQESVLVQPLTASTHELVCPPLIFHQHQPATNNLIQSCASRDGRHGGRGVGVRRLGCGFSVPLLVRNRLVLLLQLRSASEPSAHSIRSRHVARSS